MQMKQRCIYKHKLRQPRLSGSRQNNFNTTFIFVRLFYKIRSTVTSRLNDFVDFLPPFLMIIPISWIIERNSNSGNLKSRGSLKSNTSNVSPNKNIFVSRWQLLNCVIKTKSVDSRLVFTKKSSYSNVRRLRRKPKRKHR